MKTDKEIMLTAYEEMRDIDRTLVKLADLYRDRGAPCGGRRYMRIKAIVRRMESARKDILGEIYPKAQILTPEGK